jgi:hypothetical protein
MKAIRILGLLGCLGVLAACSASAASATVLCKGSENPCWEETYGTGTTIQMSLKSGTEASITGSSTVKCTGSEIKGQVEQPSGEAGKAVSGSITSLKFSGCSCSVTTLKNGTFEIAYTSAGNATFSGKGSELTVSCFGLPCIFGTGTGTTLGKLSGGKPAALSATEAKLPWISGDSSSAFCTGGSGVATLKAEYTVSAPSPLYSQDYVEEPDLTGYPDEEENVELSFVGLPKGWKKPIKFTNTGPRAQTLLSEAEIQINGVKNENEFAIIAGGTCVLGKTVLKLKESCTVTIEFASGTPNRTSTLTLWYGTAAIPKWRVEDVKIKS